MTTPQATDLLADYADLDARVNARAGVCQEWEELKAEFDVLEVERSNLHDDIDTLGCSSSTLDSTVEDLDDAAETLRGTITEFDQIG